MNKNNINYNLDKKYSEGDIVSFWNNVALEFVKWDKPFSKAYSGNEYNPEWFKDGLVNVCNNALDVHLKNDKIKDSVALYYECPSKGIKGNYTYHQLWKKVCIFSRVLRNQGIVKGDRVLIYMPNCVEAIIAMLSCARVGAVHCNTYSAYSSKNLSIRIEHLKPKLVVCANFGVKGNDYYNYIPIIKEALDLSSFKSMTVIVVDRIDLISKQKQRNFINQNTDIKIDNSLDWEEITKDVEPLLDYEMLNSTDPLYISYTSGTTGQPKGLVVDTGGFLVKSCYSFKHNYNLQPGETFFSTADIGWQIGQNLIYFSLLQGIGCIVYEGGGIETSYDYFRIIEEYRVSIFLTVPVDFRTFRKMDPEANIISKYNLGSLKAIALCGEVLDRSVIDFIKNKIKKPIVDNYGQTEGGSIITYPLGQLPYKEKSVGKPLPGLNVTILSPTTKQIAKPNEVGEIVIKLPLPPCFSLTLLLDVNQESYYKKNLNSYPGYYSTNDLGYYDEEGYYYIVSRVDDVINLGGHLIYSKAYEDIIQNNSKILDNVVVPIKDELFGQVPVAFVVLKDQFKQQIQDPTSLKNEINQSLRETEYFDHAILEHLVIVSSLPKTNSNKKSRNILTKMFNSK
ncbi:hypothetical protein DICPUDRAFT_43581 [Dictyostelium purpureum]|uniref:AMP-dependent synthetase/ligase domain-containing protein n=1 Tax=Dictyostelium purpureum TaxID=5786 RepID=F1A4C8_DICPU|nr:uncharacterized protein DICPUDRAFT_43581 [Dictyostelium purpureum]EGC28951.1 hypothetical protein DICPUDRAFT_43581 [Dictyostelium purpureum]|eukprot:XP_003294521.1 hypothetical protein DICPUDRAFT_43581 [Dictyostelium purpureum]